MKRVTRTAREWISYGSFVAFDDEECWPDPTTDKGGIACRPGIVADDKGYHAGSRVTIQTDGEIFADFGGTVWVNLKKGRLV